MSSKRLPFFTICVPLYNAKKYIKQCIESVLEQSFTDFELLIVDDGSTDGGEKIADEYAGNDTRIRVIHQNNKGIFHTRITLADAAKGNFIISLDSDDYLEKDALSTIKRIIDDTETDLLIYNYISRFQNGKSKASPKLFENLHCWDTDKKELFSVFCGTSRLNAVWRKAIKRELILTEPLKIMPRIGMGDDWIHSFYPIVRAKKVVYTDAELLNYRILNTSLTGSYNYDCCRVLPYMLEFKLQLVENKLVSKENAELYKMQFLNELAKYIAVIPGRVKDKAAYFDMLERLRLDDKTRALYQANADKVNIKTKFVLCLLYKKRDGWLLLIKNLASAARKRR